MSLDPRLDVLDELDVKAAIAPFGQERTLPGTVYTSPAVFAWEMDRLWHGGWVAVGRVAEVPPGHAMETSIGTESLVLVNDGEIRAFYNVCRHRGHEILAPGESRSVTSLRCPYHGWVYGLDGRVRVTPKVTHRTDLDDVTLVPVRVEAWHGWLMVTIDETTPPLADYLGSLGDHIAPWRAGSLMTVHRTQYEVAANWKLIHENYHECYHCPSIHPQLTAVANTDSGDNLDADGAWVGGPLRLRSGVETMSLDGRSPVGTLPGLPARLSDAATYVAIVPNLLISLHPDYVVTHRLEAAAADRTVIHCEWLFDEAAAAEPAFDPTYAVDFWDMTNAQDWRACESLQRGAASQGYRPGVLGSGEDAVYQFIGMIARSYLGEQLRGLSNPGRRL